MTITNTSSKVIGLGNDEYILPGETKALPEIFENSEIINTYKSMGMVTLAGKPSAKAKTKGQGQEIATDDAENLRKARIASLKGISQENLASLATQLGINPAECKDQADVLKKVKAALGA